MSWLIIDKERELYWKKNSHGYVLNVDDAKIFTDEEASEVLENNISKDLLGVDYRPTKKDLLIVVKEVGKDGYVTKIDNKDDDPTPLQEIVKGYWQMFGLTDGLHLIINEEGKIFGHEYNFSIPCHEGQFEDICGDVAVVRVSGENFVDLLPEDLIFLDLVNLI